MAENATPAGATPVTDRRVPPRGVLPRGMQTWIMAGLAGGIVLIVVLAGRPTPPARPIPVTPAAQPPTADRLRDYQDRIRILETRANQEARAGEPPASLSPSVYGEPRSAAPPVDPLEAERKRREYESLFATNVVLSRRPDADRPEAARTPFPAANQATPASLSMTPSVDEIADAAFRATVRAGAVTRAVFPPLAQQTSEPAVTPPSAAATAQRSATPANTQPISAAGPLHRLLEGTFIDTVLTNRLDGSAAAPLNCLVTNAVYSHGGQQVVIPAGARILGETKPVQAFGQTRLAAAFHRLLMPDGRTYSLDRFLGLNQIGDAGLRDQVNQHYWSTFGAAAAVGLISGLAQYLGTGGLAGGSGDRLVVIAGGATGGTAQATVQVMNRFLNRLPTLTIREGHRVKVYLTNDLELPAYEPASMTGR